MPPKKAESEQSNLEAAVKRFADDIPFRILGLMDMFDQELLSHKPYEDFAKDWASSNGDFDTMAKCDAITDIIKMVRPVLWAFSKDMCTAGTILPEIWKNFGIDQDLKVSFDEMKKNVNEEIGFQEMWRDRFIEFWGCYYNYRAMKALESRVSDSAEDLCMGLWVIDQQMVRECQSELLWLTTEYFHLMAAIVDTYEQLEVPGIIGKRKYAVKRTRKQIYG